MAITLDVARSIEDLALAHGVKPPERPKKRPTAYELEEEVRLLKEQRDTVARQWMAQNLKIEAITRTCLFCDFEGKSRNTLKTHMRAKHLLG